MHEQLKSFDDALFSMETVLFRRGEAVTVQTIWGDEGGVVIDVMSGRGHGWPMASVLMDLGDTISVDVARLQKRPPL